MYPDEIKWHAFNSPFTQYLLEHSYLQVRKPPLLPEAQSKQGGVSVMLNS